MEKRTKEQKARDKEIDEAIGSGFYREAQTRIGFENFRKELQQYSDKLTTELEALEELKKRMQESHTNYCDKGEGSMSGVLTDYLTFYEELENSMKEMPKKLEELSNTAKKVRNLAYDCTRGVKK